MWRQGCRFQSPPASCRLCSQHQPPCNNDNVNRLGYVSWNVTAHTCNLPCAPRTILFSNNVLDRTCQCLCSKGALRQIVASPWRRELWSLPCLEAVPTVHTPSNSPLHFCTITTAHTTSLRPHLLLHGITTRSYTAISVERMLNCILGYCYRA